MADEHATKRPGTLVGERYRVVRPLGHGAHGVVYEAENVWTGRHVALKLLRPELAGDAEVVRRFHREARAGVGARHPNLVDTLDMGEDPEDGALYIVQSLLEGEDLRALLAREERLPVGRALDVIVPVLGALAAAHARAVVHRDLKPENIFLARQPSGVVTPTVIDLGVAKVAGAAQGTLPGSRLGTPRYMAPEQARGEVDVDARADVWSAGAVLFEMIAGFPAFEGDDAVDVLRRVTGGRAPLLDKAAPGTARALVEIVARALEPDRERRFASAVGFLDALLGRPELDGPGLAERHRASIPARPEPAPPSAPPPWREAPPKARPQLAKLAAALAFWGAGAALGWALVGPAKPEWYRVAVRVEPPDAALRLDDGPPFTGLLSVALPRDGHTHTLTASAPGYRAGTVIFRDAPPPARLALEPR